MRLHYIVSFKDANLFVKIEEKGSKRILYWDTLSALAVEEDKAALLFFRKILTRFSRNLETLQFQRIEVPQAESFEAMRLLAGTGRVTFKERPLLCDWKGVGKVMWRGEETGRFSAFLQYKEEEIPFESCDRVFPLWCISLWRAFPIQSSVPWKWVELFFKGPVLLEGVQKKWFLEEQPPLQWIKNETLPRLVLTDATGCFANLAEGSAEWEKDLLDAGYLLKPVGNSKYFCPGDKMREALFLLLDVGWEIFLPGGKRLYRQTEVQWDLRQEAGGVAVRGSASFQEKKAPLRLAMEAFKKGRMWIDIDSESAGLIDLKKGALLDGEWMGDVLRLPRNAAAELLPLLDFPEAQWEDSLLQTVRGLKEGGEKQASLPGPSFKGELMAHQQKGVDWLDFLYRWGFSGLLADEMGLGKTVQVLAFFSRLRTNLPVLIVAPASLLFHWRAELERFLPFARVLVYLGGEETLDSQYVIISYARLRIDEERLSQIEWETVVLDESNAIKTASTQTAKAACRLKGRFRIALSGTPMENRVDEIGSQFKFLLPSLIQNMEMDIRKIKPFILRRKKDEIDLPEKMEQTSFIEMEEEQSNLYNSYSAGIRNGLLKKVALDGASAYRMEILEAILRLRQIAADPRLIGHEIRGAKIERLIADVEEALQEKRKVLIYSQFTSMLSLIGKELTAPFLYLDGSVPLKERAERVKRFQEDPGMPLFLLSLKAGGVGLNLTAADYILLFDPWWNEAVENQAIDRAHRIGQKHTVIAKRYIVPATIEEKMLKLKAEKTKAAEAILDESGDFFSWTEEDLLHLLS